jgi:hypothetical protein
MSGQVVALPGHCIPHPQGEPIPDIVAKIEDLLAEAKAGTLRGVAICSVIEDGTEAPIMDVYWDYRCKSTAMGFAVTRLFHRFNGAEHD